MTQAAISSRASHSRLPTTGFASEKEQQWKDTCQEFLVSVPADMHDNVERSLNNLHTCGPGLRAWVSSIAWRGGKLPEVVPSELINVYLADPEAVPVHDCESCGIAVPVRPHRLFGMEAEPEQTYFPVCPVCGGRTGMFMYMSRRLEESPAASTLRRSKPR